jgi:DNA-directed RNA polymerase subunit H (RpoH/RPB5)
MDLELANLINKTRGNLLNMLKYRGFNINNIATLNLTEIIDILNIHKSAGLDNAGQLSLLDIYLENNETKRKVIVKYRLDDKFNSTKKIYKQINDIYSSYKLTSNDCVILIINKLVIQKYEKKRNSTLNKFLNTMYEQGKFIQVFGLQNFLINISEHIFVPKHRIMTKEEITTLVDKYKTTVDNLPKILREDPMAKFIGAKPNDVIHIKGYNEAAGYINKYRLCISSE